MNKRNEYIYELVGIIRGRKSQEFKNRECFKLIVELSNKENIHFIQAFKDKVNNQIWQDLEKKNFIDKKYLFYCRNWMGIFRLINWKELKDYGSN